MRLLDRDVVTLLQKEALVKQYQRLNPVRPLHQINQALEGLWGLAEPPDHNDDSVTLPSEATTVLGEHSLLTQHGVAPGSVCGLKPGRQ